MKFYSEDLNRLFDSEKELVEAETKEREAKEAKKKAEEEKKKARATRAKEVEVALKRANAAQSVAINLLKEFINDYGYYHTSYTSKDDEVFHDAFLDLFSSILD